VGLVGGAPLGTVLSRVVRVGKVRRATVDDVRRLAESMPGVTRAAGDNAVYQVSRRSFVFFRNPRPDAVDPETGERYDDVIVFWVASDEDKRVLLADDALPFFTTSHFDGHRSVLVRGCRIGELDVDELAEIVADAWLARASTTAGRTWLAERGLADDR